MSKVFLKEEDFVVEDCTFWWARLILALQFEGRGEEGIPKRAISSLSPRTELCLLHVIPYKSFYYLENTQHNKL